VFERFHRIEVARTYEGTGIGLAFVRLGVESIYLNRRGSRNRDSALDRWPILSTRSIEAATLLRQMSLRVVTPFVVDPETRSAGSNVIVGALVEHNVFARR
jgi:hypothetical protein